MSRSGCVCVGSRPYENKEMSIIITTMLNPVGNLLTLMAGHVEKHLKEFIGRHFGLKVAVPTEARRRRTLIGIASGCIIYSSLPAVGKAGVGFGDCFEGFFCIRGFVFVRMKFKGSLP